jgi:hypothetical protein
MTDLKIIHWKPGDHFSDIRGRIWRVDSVVKRYGREMLFATGVSGSQEAECEQGIVKFWADVVERVERGKEVY